MESDVKPIDIDDINDKMTNWIADHPNLIKYLNLEEVFPTDVSEIPITFQQKRTAKHEKIINSLKRFYDIHVQKLEPEKYGPSKLKTFLPKLLNNKYSYVCYKIDTIKRKQFDEYSKNVAQILSFFNIDSPEESSIPGNIIFNFDLVSFEKDSFQETHNLLALKKLAETFEKINSNTKKHLIQLSKNKSNQKRILNRVIDSINSIYDNESSYFPIGSYDQIFENFFYSPIFPFTKEYNHLIQNFSSYPPNSLITLVLQLAHKIIKYYGLKVSPTDSILFLLIFRCLYNDIYPLNILPFFTPNLISNQINETKELTQNSNQNTETTQLTQNSNRINEINSVTDDLKQNPISFFEFINKATFATFDPPADSLISQEENYKPENQASLIVSKDPRFASPISDLLQIIFETNPLDALNSVRRCLRAIEQSSELFFDTKKLIGMISFDQVFSIFLLVIAGSELQELFEIYTPFISNTLPEKMLSLPFQFSLTKLQAAETHIKSLIELQKNDS